MSPGIGPSASLEKPMPSKPDTPCSRCGKLLWSRPNSLPAERRICKGCTAAAPVERPCRDCGTLVETQGTFAVCDPCKQAVLAEHWRKKNRLRRAALRGVASEPYTLTDIAVRDKRRCQLCRKPVAMKRQVPHPKAPTIDHVIPLADGGDNTRVNVQLAHFQCNSRKGAGGIQQLALMG